MIAYKTIHTLLLMLCCIILTLPSMHSQLFESSIELTAFGTAFQPRDVTELLETYSNIQRLVQCAVRCNQNRQCRTFDYDVSSLVCRLFEGDISTGTVLNISVPSPSRIASIRSNTTKALQQYLSYNQSWEQCGMGINRYLQCNNNACQCPIHTYWTGRLCLNQLRVRVRVSKASQDMFRPCSI